MTKKVMLVSPVWRNSTAVARKKSWDVENICRKIRQRKAAALIDWVRIS